MTDTYEAVPRPAEGLDGACSDAPEATRNDMLRFGNGVRSELSNADVNRPLEVPGPLGQPITLASLPPPDTRRWVVRRKAEVIAAIRGGLLTAAEACARYRLSPEELELWQESIDRAGVPGLRVTRIQLYKDYQAPKPRTDGARQAERPAPHAADLSRGWGI